MKQFRGIGLSPGAAAGFVHIHKKAAAIPENKKGRGLEIERERFFDARAAIAEHLKQIAHRMEHETGKKEADIFVAHSRIAMDRTLERETMRLIEAESVCAEWALYNAAAKLVERLSATGDPVISARADDIRDVSGHIVRHLMDIGTQEIEIAVNSIIVADELLPSDTALFPKDKIIGFITEKGGFTSHVAIMARALEIPAVAGITDIVSLADGQEHIVIDGTTGEVVMSPDMDTLADFENRAVVYQEEKALTAVYKTAGTMTADGARLLVEANIGSMADLDAALENGCEGVGLFRTEFLFMQSDRVPSEDEQYAIYSAAAKKLTGRPLIIRTLDIGGDKPIRHLNIEKEENPFLGLRAIRYSLKHEQVFMDQIRAILRAGNDGKVQLMLPMIATLDELLAAKALIAQAIEQLKEADTAYAEVPVGIMIEVPSAAIMADVFAEHCDFFSIGTNDLIQYTVAVDRGNNSVSYLYNMCEPAVLRLISTVIKSAHEKQIPVGMCGEAAAYLPVVPALVAMGLDAFSVSPPLIPQVRAAIHQCDTAASAEMLSAVKSFCSAVQAEKQLTGDK